MAVLGNNSRFAVSNEEDKVSFMNRSCQAAFLSMLVSSFACGQEYRKPSGQLGPPPLALKLKKDPKWKGNCLEMTVQRTNVSLLSIFLDATYDGLKVYSSVSDATNTLGQGSGEAWMLVYGWTDVISEPIELSPKTRRQTTLCIGETFPVKETGKDSIRQIRLQGRLRIVAGYELPSRRTIDHSLGNGKRAYVSTVDMSVPGTFGEVTLEVPIPCPNGVGMSKCLSPPQIFPGEHDVQAVELEPPPPIEIQPPRLPIIPIDQPGPPRP